MPGRDASPSARSRPGPALSFSDSIGSPMPSSGAAAGASYPSSEPHMTAMPSCPWNLPRDRPQLAGDGPRTLARLAAWPLVSVQSASGGSMSRWPEDISEGNAKRARY